MSSPLLLPPLIHVRDVAQESRDAYLHFLDEVCSRRGKQELAAWLTGSYRMLTARAGDTRAAEAARAASVQRIEEAQIDRLLVAVHREVLAVLHDASIPDGGASFAAATVRAGYVVRCVDVNGGAGWLPRARPRMRLADRVLSLVAVDWLASAEPFERELAICLQCSRVSFDAESRKRGACRAHPTSGIRLNGAAGAAGYDGHAAHGS